MRVLWPIAGVGQTPRCLRWRARRPGEDTLAEYVCDEYETVTPPQTTTPTTSRLDCNMEFLRWGRDNMSLVPCVNSVPDADRWRLLCARVERGEITLAQARNMFTYYARQQCAAQTPPPAEPPPPRQPPPPPTAPPEMPPGVPDPGRTPGDRPPLLEPEPGVTDGGATPGDDVTQDDWRRRFGPIVGIGLLLAAGLTVYRVKRKPRRRR